MLPLKGFMNTSSPGQKQTADLRAAVYAPLVTIFVRQAILADYQARSRKSGSELPCKRLA